MVSKKIIHIIVMIIFMNVFNLGAVSSDSMDVENTINNLELLLNSIHNISNQIKELQRVLQSSSGLGREQEIRLQITELSQKLKELNRNFSQLSSDVDFQLFEPDEQKKIDIQSEIKELAEPLLRELKKMTSHPREVEALKTQINIYEQQIKIVSNALDNLTQILSHPISESLKNRLQEDYKNWEQRQNELQARINISIQQLQQKTTNRRSWSETFQEFFQLFFKSRGRNIILSFLAFIITWLIFHHVHNLIKRFSPFHQKDRSVYIRTFDMVYSIITAIASLLSILAVLYFFGDWFLLSIAIIFVIGLAWASKQTIPLYWRQMRLILNLGTVREGELVVYKGLPYEVASINISTELVNHKIDGGRLLLPLKDLYDLRSRPITPNEPWFPSEKGDWILLKNGHYGQVQLQTPEVVEMKLISHEIVSIKTSEFLSFLPTNLTHGFQIWSSFGFDYSLDKQIHSLIPILLKKQIRETLHQKGFEKSIKHVNVLFDHAGTFALCLTLIVEFDGSVCQNYYQLRSLIQQSCLDICTEQKWPLPYQKIQVNGGSWNTIKMDDSHKP